MQDYGLIFYSKRWEGGYLSFEDFSLECRWDATKQQWGLTAYLPFPGSSGLQSFCSGLFRLDGPALSMNLSGPQGGASHGVATGSSFRPYVVNWIMGFRSGVVGRPAPVHLSLKGLVNGADEETPGAVMNYISDDAGMPPMDMGPLGSAARELFARVEPARAGRMDHRAAAAPLPAWPERPAPERFHGGDGAGSWPAATPASISSDAARVRPHSTAGRDAVMDGLGRDVRIGFVA